MLKFHTHTHTHTVWKRSTGHDVTGAKAADWTADSRAAAIKPDMKPREDETTQKDREIQRRSSSSSS